MSWDEFSRFGTSSEKARKTRSDPNFQKTAISETRENQNFGKNRLTHGLSPVDIKMDIVYFDIIFLV